MIGRKKSLKKHRSARKKWSKTRCFVYGLYDGEECFYIGQTRMLLSERLRWHLKDVGKRKALGQRLSPVQARMANMAEPPRIQMVDESGIWDVSEAVWIDRFTTQGHKLLNVLARVA
jgi:hypothetical protein